MVLATIQAVVSVVLVAFGAFGVYESRLYTAAQRARAPRLRRANLALMGLLTALGLGGLALAVGPGYSAAFSVAVPVISFAAVLVQAAMYRRMGLDRSPGWERLVAHVRPNGG